MIAYNKYLDQDVRMAYYKPFTKGWFLDWCMKSEQFYLRKYVRLLRSEEYYTFIKPSVLKRMWYARKKNILGAKLGFFIPAGCFGPDLKIAHYGSIIVNPNARIGSGCTLHGNCCIGNKGTESYSGDSPIIGNNVNIGQNAQVIGPVQLRDNVIIAAGAIVTKSFDEDQITLVGCPAQKMKN